MERWQSTHEHEVGVNLSESGVEPVSLSEILDEKEIKALLRSPQGYAETRGSQDLREAVASLYPGCGPENVLVTTGTSEANLLVSLGALERDSQAVTILPNYLQVWGLATSMGCDVAVLHLEAESGWQFDEEDAKEKIGPDTRAISLCNPNNPTGVRLTAKSRKAIVDLAAEAGAWILSDEVYRGAEREGDLTRSLWGEYEKALVTSGFSKAFGLPGLRLGWICGPQEMIEKLWSIHDYTTIAVSTITAAIGAVVMAHWREKLWERAREIIRRNFPLVEAFVAESGSTWTPPEAGAIAFVRYPWGLPSDEVAQRALDRGVLLVPGVHFHEEGFVRLGFGMEREILVEGLRRLKALGGDLGHVG